MTWRDALALVVTQVRRRAARSALTVAAVALAATLLTSLVTIATTAQNRVLSEVSTGGPLAGIKVAAAAPDPSQVDRDDARPGAPKPLDDAALNRVRGLRDVQAVYPVVAVPVVVVGPLHLGPGPTPTGDEGAVSGPGDGPIDPYGDSLIGLPLADATRLPVTLLAGRLPTARSLTEVVVTPGYLDRFHLSTKQAGLALGTRVEVGFPRGFATGAARARWVRPTVVGVAAQDAGPGQFIGSVELAAVGRDWTLAGGTGGAQRFGLQATTYTGLFVIADRLDRVTAVRARINAVGYSTSAPENLIASVKRYLRVVDIVLAAVSAIALVVAALGIANAMYAAVRERRREIGVLKAIGARDRDVLRIFVLEALLIGAVGGVIGAAAGTGVAGSVGWAVNRYLRSQGIAGIRMALRLDVLAGAVAGSTVLAVLAGVAPARQASRLPAREAVAE